MRKIAAAVALVLMTTAGAAAQPEGQVVSYIDGEALTKSCRDYLVVQRATGSTSSPSEGYGTGLCYGFVVGLVEATGWRVSDGGHEATLGEFCIPEGLNARSVTETVAIWLDAHPEQRSGIGYALVRRALAEKFPC